MKRVDAREKVTGRAIYADDMHMDGMLYGAPLHSEYPAAKVLGIDISKAKAQEGVLEVITAKDVPGSNLVGGIIADEQVFADREVFYSGDAIALVVAESAEVAREAAKLIAVDYDPTRPLLSPKESLAQEARKAHEDRPNNVVTSFKVRHDETGPAFKESAEVVEAKFNTTFVEHAYLEPESCVAVPEADGSVTVHGGMQHPFTTRRFVARATGLPLSKARIIQTTLGGGFGGKDDTISVICARAAIAALRTKKPVKITYVREESIRESYKRHPMELCYKAGIDKKGKFTAMDVDITADSGAYCSTSPFVIWRPTVQCTGPYIVPKVRCDSRSFYTNNSFTGAMRGFGTPQHVFACESFIDICAERAGMDPLEFRKKNFFRQGSTTHTGQKFSDHNVSVLEVAEKALGEIGWKKRFKECSRGKVRDDGLLYGTGFACSYRGVSLGAEGNDFCSAIVNVEPDGSVVMEVGVSENGQGLKTAMVSILCRSLGIEAERVEFLDTDTSTVPDGGPTVASRGTLVGGNATLNACERIKELMGPAIVDLIGASKKGYVFENGKINNPQTKKSVPFEKAVAECHARGINLSAVGAWHGPDVNWDDETGQGNAYFTYVYGCQACELSVNPADGKVQVQRVVAAHEVGKAINPQMAAGQIFGGISMGLGFALMERIEHKEGRIQNLNYNTYRIPRSTDVPEMTAILVENPDPAGPYGAKSLGEPTNELMGAAVANAIYNATGVRFFETPITADSVLRSLNSR
jgi:CO/xanthine dehydrogenase Mo-binding subunit